MDAMILSAGLGVRMRPLTSNIPKPLLSAGDKLLIEYQLERLSNAGFNNIVINTSFGFQQFRNALGNGEQYGVQINYSLEGDIPLETGGGILKALPLIQSDPFLIVNADIWTDFPYQSLSIPESSLAQIVLVNNPEHNDKGDFIKLGELALLPTDSRSSQPLTYTGIAVLRKKLFENVESKVFPLYSLLVEAVQKKRLTCTYYNGLWFDIGTPDRLQSLIEFIENKN